MRCREIISLVTTSSREDWTIIGDGPLYLESFGTVISGDLPYLETESHHYLAVYETDVDLRLAWGLLIDDDLVYDGWVFPNRAISRVLVDAFWRGSLVARWSVLDVDGHRCYLPEVRRGDGDAGGWTATADEIALARLLHEVVRQSGSEFDNYLGRANITEVQ